MTSVRNSIESLKKLFEEFDSRESIDQPFPSNVTFVSQPGECVQLQLEKSDLPPLTVASFFFEAVEKFANKTAMVFQVDNEWNTMTFQDYYVQSINVARSFIALGLEPNETVVMVCFNSAALFVSILGCILAGGYRPLFLHILLDTKANFVLVDSHKVLSEVRCLWDELPHLKDVVMADVSIKKMNNNPHIFTWKEFLQKGEETNYRDLAFQLTVQAPNKCCAIFYMTDYILGTTKPSGVMMSQDNFTYMARLLCKKVSHKHQVTTKLGKKTNHRILSFLPLTWPFGVTFEIFLSMALGATVFFGNKEILHGKLVDSLRLFRPTLFTATNRQWMKMHAVLKRQLKCQAWPQNQIITLCQYYHLLALLQRFLSHKTPAIVHPKNCIAYMINKVKRKIGLEQCKMFLSYGGPLRLETLQFFLGLDIPLRESYDSYLLAGPHTINGTEDYKLGSVGKPLPEFSLKILTSSTFKLGKLYIRGRHVCMGLLHEAIDDVDEEGYIYTGMTAKSDSDEYLYITGTTEEILMLENGCKIDPVSIERFIIEHLPIISHCILVGHQCKFPALLVTLKTTTDPVTLKPMNNFTQTLQQWFKKNNIFDQTLTMLLKRGNCAVDDAIANTISYVHHVMGGRKYAYIRDCKVLSSDFSIINGEIDPLTMTINRSVILERYKYVIDQIYAQ